MDEKMIKCFSCKQLSPISLKDDCNFVEWKWKCKCGFKNIMKIPDELREEESTEKMKDLIGSNYREFPAIHQTS